LRTSDLLPQVAGAAELIVRAIDKNETQLLHSRVFIHFGTYGEWF
jgi:hypothetical protein